MHVPYRVLLPKRIFEQANNEQEVQALIREYMQRYPHYDLIRKENYYAICERINSNDTRRESSGKLV